MDKLMRLPAVMDSVGLSRSTIYARIGTGTFPAPINIGGRAVAWRQSEIEAWIANPATWKAEAPPDRSGRASDATPTHGRED